jgi:cytochrome c2
MASPNPAEGWISCRRILWFLAIAAGFGAGLAGCHRAPPLTPQEAEGKHLYSVRCAHCHEDNDLALKKVPPELHDVFSRTALPSGAPATDPDVKRIILSGKGMMPSFAGRFSDDQMNDLLAYLHTGLR